MAGVVNKAAKAPGTVTVGIDQTGKHYKYESGKGRGRQPLNLTPRQAGVLRAKGLKPGSTIGLDATTAAQLGISGATAGAQRYAAHKTKTSQNSKALAAKILQNHAKWMQQPGRGRKSTADRLKLLLGNGRGDALSHAGKNPSEAQRALAAAVLGTIFSRGVKQGGGKSTGGNKASGFKVKFSPGGKNKEGYIRLVSNAGEQIAGVSFKNLQSITPEHIDAIRSHFDKAFREHLANREQPDSQVAAPAKQVQQWHNSVNTKIAEKHQQTEPPKPLMDQLGKLDKHTGFKTAKGSSYQIHEDGTTTRNKAARPDPGHEGDSGPKERTHRTVYADADLVGALSSAGVSDVGGKGHRLVIKDGKASLLSWNQKENRWGVSSLSRNHDVSNEPEVGKAPLELWHKADDVPGFPEAYKKQHAGNKITEMS